jgi:hypothetical protein
MKTQLKVMAVIGLGLLILGLVFTKLGHCANNNVTDNGNGNQGYILVSTGNGHQGAWTNPSDISTLKGDKGDKGDTGSQGIQGIKGDTGNQGISGINGLNGTNGINGKDGLNGINGIDGQKGDKGDTGIQGIQGNTGDKGATGNTGENGKDIDMTTVNKLKDTDTSLDNKINTNILSINNQEKQLQDHNNRLNDHENRLNDLEKTQYVIEGGARILDTRKYEVVSFIRYNQGRNIIDTIGVRLTFKIGKSYEETLIDKQNNRLNELERKISQSYTIEKVYDTKGNLKSEKISTLK